MEKAFRLYSEASEKSEVRAATRVGFYLVQGWGVAQNEEKGVRYLRKALRDGDMHALDAPFVNVSKSISYFEISADFDTGINYRDDTHWYRAIIYETEEGSIDDNRALYHYRLAADLGQVEAREVVEEYFVRGTAPRKMSSTNEELQLFLQKMRTQYSRRNRNARNFLAPHVFPSTANIGSLDSISPENVQPTVDQNPIS